MAYTGRHAACGPACSRSRSTRRRTRLHRDATLSEHQGPAQVCCAAVAAQCTDAAARPGCGGTPRATPMDTAHIRDASACVCQAPHTFDLAVVYRAGAHIREAAGVRKARHSSVVPRCAATGCAVCLPALRGASHAMRLDPAPGDKWFGDLGRPGHALRPL